MSDTPDTQEVAVVKTQATKALMAAQALEIKTPEDMTVATDHLAKMKQVAKMIKERKEAITKPLMEALTSARDLFKPIEQNLAAAEAIMKNKMLAYQRIVDEKAEKDRLALAKRVEKGTMKPETAVAKMEGIQDAPTSVQGKSGAMSFRTVKKYRVVDASALPREFLTPDMGKITEALKAGRSVPGAEMYEEKVVASSSILDADHPFLGQKKN